MSRRSIAPRPRAPSRGWAACAAALTLACGGPERNASPAVAAPVAEPSARPSEPSTAPSSPAATPPDFADPTWNRTPSRAGTYVVQWRSLSGKVPRNEDFTLEVWVLRDGKAVTGAFLDVHAWMPDHGHGMLRQPRAQARADGSYLVEGMLLHMRGRWQLFFDVLEGTLAETAECALDL